MNGYNSGSNSLRVLVDHLPITTLHTKVGAWTWQRAAQHLELDGPHDLTLALRESETRSDKIIITDDLAWVPTGLGPEPDDPGQAVHLFVAEAEHYSLLDGAFTQATSPDASQATYMVVPNAVGADYDGDGHPLANLHYDLNLQPGTYTVWIRAFGQDPGSDSLYVALDAGDKIKLTTRRDGFQWHRVRGAFHLNGKHILTISLREANTFLDKLIVTDDPDWIPEGFGPTQD